MLEGGDDVLAEARREDVLLRPKLVSRLSDDGVDDVQPGDFVFWLALLATEPCQSAQVRTLHLQRTKGLWKNIYEIGSHIDKQTFFIAL